ncbi:MAG: DUF1156 domain-containing protein [Candidatus Cloacimonetes bacterium]|nr:DUF1156 domain-containing protein [Candidatus Cloacimonadota bacterium]
MPKKKLIEVALPLEVINQQSAREKSIRHGHPSTLHLWWSRKPLATARSVLFAQLVDDPSAHPETFPTEVEQEKERKRLFKIMEKLSVWEHVQGASSPELNAAIKEIQKSCGLELPAIYDPFSGGGSIPLEAQRLGLNAYGSDLNPVAVMIGRALIDIPARFSAQTPINPDFWAKTQKNQRLMGAAGLASDLEYYGQKLNDLVFEKIGSFYPTVKSEWGEKTVIAWLWCRTVPSPDPRFENAPVPLTSSFLLCAKKGKEVYARPVITGSKIHFEIVFGADAPEGTVNRNGGTCLLSGRAMPFTEIRAHGKAGRMGQMLMAVVVDGDKGREYLPATKEMVELAESAKPIWGPEVPIPHNPRDFKTPNYGLPTIKDLFSPRQLLALTTFSDALEELQASILADAKNAGSLPEDSRPLAEGGCGALAYSEALMVYLALAVDKLADRLSTIASWDSGYVKVRNTFARQAIPMTWDFAECNPFSSSSGNFMGCVEWGVKVLQKLPARGMGQIAFGPAQAGNLGPQTAIISTDPPYYDNIGYADLSDFFYVWLRKSLKSVYPKLFATLQVPKAEELVATPYRHGSKQKAEDFFMAGMQEVFASLQKIQHQEFPLAIYYAFKQQEIKDGSTTSTGWASFLQAVLDSGWEVVRTWPMRTELMNRMLASGTNALASSIVLVCRPRQPKALTMERREFLQELRKEIPKSLKILMQSGIAPVDMAQSIIGPGISVFSRAKSVLESDGSQMSVATALGLINQVVDEVLTESFGTMDPQSRFCLDWLLSHGFSEGSYGDAETLSKAKNISLSSLEQRKIIKMGGGKLSLVGLDHLPDVKILKDYSQNILWQDLLFLMHGFRENGETGAASVYSLLGTTRSSLKDLAYRVFNLLEKKGLSADALWANAIVKQWDQFTSKATTVSTGVGLEALRNRVQKE